jgi:hypothetical protein
MAFWPRSKAPNRTAALNFPNESRSYDATRHAVRFWAYDSAMEIPFYVATDALMRLQPGITSDETGYLRAFDTHTALIRAVAIDVYTRGSRGCYDLTASDFPTSAR